MFASKASTAVVALWLGAMAQPSLQSTGWVSGEATHYGPFPQYEAWSEPGFQPNAVGVGCASGSNDPRWKAIVAQGLRKNPPFPANKKTVYPIRNLVAVSEAVYGGANKQKYCFQNVAIRNKANGKSITATIVDFCPASGCLWKHSALAHNVDIYGGSAWAALGGQAQQGTLEIEVKWPSVGSSRVANYAIIGNETEYEDSDSLYSTSDDSDDIGSRNVTTSAVEEAVPSPTSAPAAEETWTAAVLADEASGSWQQCPGGQLSQTYDCKPNSQWVCVLGRCECQKDYTFNTNTGNCVEAQGVDNLRIVPILPGQHGFYVHTSN
ncbi:uncharacterized protein BJ171DRAFT_442760 [Polychytrium aggregatum]|uniref:uncharacterized protein n=1 Tax=Polychytrium aggregatum TaxID=110093 RepID=UPI0022FF2DF3|nr:uncharacterized protein BJ171DRAFT_442760 [Polychytrium aggregatum]KAI9203939.1 hypothetical protein BJ171DRAFT_442760 [Polychytrium aggregatum]